MLTVTNWKSLLMRFTGISQAEANDYGIQLLNVSRAKVLTSIDSYITEDIFTAKTVAAQQSYALPVNCFKIEDISVLVGSVRYSPKIVENARQWHQLTIVNTPQSTIPMFVYIDKDKISFYPTPSASGSDIRAIVTLKEADLTNEDAIGGTITATNGSSTITGAGTNFLATNVGWKIQLPDNVWYKVSAVASATSLTVSKLFEGATTSGATYRLGQASVIPEEGQILPVYDAAMTIFLSQEKNAKAAEFRTLYTGTKSPTGEYLDGIGLLRDKYGNKTEGQLNSGWDNNRQMKNYNDYPIISG